MTPLEALPLVLWGVPVVAVTVVVAREVSIELMRRSWNRRAERLIASVEERQALRAAERILSDADLITSVQIQFLDECWSLPCAPEPR